MIPILTLGFITFTFFTILIVHAYGYIFRNIFKDIPRIHKLGLLFSWIFCLSLNASIIRFAVICINPMPSHYVILLNIYTGVSVLLCCLGTQDILNGIKEEKEKRG